MYNLNKFHLLLCTLILSMGSLASNEEVFERANTGVVLIMGDDGFGSGALISSQGYILTNWHVVEGAENLEVALHHEYDLGDDFQEYFFEAKVIKAVKKNDLALIKILLSQLGFLGSVKLFPLLVLKFMP